MPESLVHSYAKQQVARMGELRLPGLTVEGRQQSPDGTVHSLHWRYLPTYDIDVKGRGGVPPTRWSYP